MNYNDYMKENFEQIAKIPGVWLSSAQKLKCSAEILNAELIQLGNRIKDKEIIDLSLMRISEVYILLAGLSLENLIKGILISQNPDIVKDDKLPFSGSGHEIIKYFKEANIDLDSDEEKFLNKAEEFILCFGRYPIYKAAKKYDGRKEKDIPLIGIQTDAIIFNKLYLRLSDMYEKPNHED